MVAQRVFFAIVTLFIVSAFIFLGVELLPGDAAEAILGQTATPETLAVFRRELGLDTPPHTRYVAWLGRLFHCLQIISSGIRISWRMGILQVTGKWMDIG